MQNLKNATKSLILPWESIGIRPQMKMRRLEIAERSVSFVTKSFQLKLAIAMYEPGLWVTHTGSQIQEAICSL